MRKASISLGVGVLLAAISAASVGAAGQSVLSDVRITSIGCHTAPRTGATGTVWETCFVQVDKVPSTQAPSTCRVAEFRWDTSTVSGKNSFNLLQAAFLAGKKIDFGVKNDGCYAQQTGYPTFEFLFVK